MSKAQLKKALGQLDKEEVVNVVLELYAARKEAKAYLEFWLNPDLDKELDKAMAQVDKSFRTTTGNLRKTPKMGNLTDVKKSFNSLTTDAEYQGRLLLHIAERCCDWFEERNAPERYVAPMRKMTDTAVAHFESHDLTDLYRRRIENLTTRTDELAQYAASLSNVIPRRRKYFRFGKG